MKNILQIILITFFTFTISSCAKKDDDTTATAIPATGTGTTASGTLTHPSGQEFTGTFNIVGTELNLVAGVSTIVLLLP